MNSISASQLRRIRKKHANPLLLAHGFRSTSSCAFARVHRGQIQVVDWQADMYGGSYAINLGFQYAFIPCFYAYFPGNSTDVPDAASACLTARAECCIDGMEDWYSYGSSESEARDDVLDQVSRIVGFFDQLTAEWEDPIVFLSMDIVRLLRLMADEQWADIPHSIPSFHGFTCDGLKVAYFLAHVATWCGQLDVAREVVGLGLRMLPGNNRADKAMKAAFEEILNR